MCLLIQVLPQLLPYPPSGYIDESDCWSHEDDEISQQYCRLKKPRDRDTISMMSLDSCDSRELTARGAADIRRRLSETVNAPKTGFKRDPEDPSAAALKEPWETKVGMEQWGGQPLCLLVLWGVPASSFLFRNLMHLTFMCFTLLKISVNHPHNWFASTKFFSLTQHISSSTMNSGYRFKYEWNWQCALVDSRVVSRDN